VAGCGNNLTTAMIMNATNINPPIVFATKEIIGFINFLPYKWLFSLVIITRTIEKVNEKISLFRFIEVIKIL
jgi:hypothetical protein